MNNLKGIFEQNNALIAHIMAGDPNLEMTKKHILNLQNSTVDAIMLGVPFSDPTADCPDLQKAHIRSLDAGTTLVKIFDMLGEIKPVCKKPIMFFTYLNPVFNFGYTEFLKSCEQAGISALMIPDLPYEEKDELEKHIKNLDIELITFVAASSNDRIKKLGENSSGFIYTLPCADKEELCALLESVEQVCDTPKVVSLQDYNLEVAATLADGVIVSQQLAQAVTQGEDIAKFIENFLLNLKSRTVKV